MTTKEKAVLSFCSRCDKVTYVSAINYHAQNPCRASLNGWDCMEFENQNLFCACNKAGA